jgi:hypothetical protein
MKSSCKPRGITKCVHRAQFILGLILVSLRKDRYSLSVSPIFCIQYLNKYFRILLLSLIYSLVVTLQLLAIEEQVRQHGPAVDFLVTVHGVNRNVREELASVSE